MRRDSFRRWMTAAALLAAVVAVAAWRTAAPAPAPDPPGTETTSSEVRQDAGEMRDYWTPERMQEARPRPMPEDG